MKLSKRSAAVLAAGVAGAMTLSACGGSDDGGGGGSESGGSGQVVFGESTDFPENLFPLISAGNATSTANIEAQLFPQTFEVQPDFTVKWNEELLTEEPVSEVTGDTQTVTYKLNPDAVWSDGEPITADDFDVAWRMQRSSDPANGGCPELLSTSGYEQITAVEGTDEGKTVTVTYSPPFADWQASFTGNNSPLFPAHVVDAPTQEELCAKVAAGWPIADGIPSDISGGPWQLKKENIDVGGQIAVLTPNENFWGEKPKVARLVFQNIGNDPTTAVQGLSRGELNMIYPQPQLDLVDQVADLAPNVESEISFGLSFEHLDFNSQDPHLADVNVRKAFALALDRQQVVDQTVGQFSSDAEVLNNHIWKTNQPEYEDNAPAEYNAANPEQAKQLLQQSGYTLGQDGVFTHPQRGRLAIQIDTTANNPLRQTTIEVMIPQLKAAGIEGTFNANTDIFNGPDKPTSLIAGGFQAAVFAWVGNPFVSAQPPIYQSPQGDAVGQNYARVGTPEIDALFAELIRTTERERQVEITNQIDVLLWDLMPTLPLYQKPTFIAYSSNIDGVVDNPTQAGPLWNASTWTVE
ncbi:MAG: putative Extracellular solute-binding protein [Modestobacter sp.]|nr:putative Extracellular solute-binding protein [Modestobacter sp.]